MGQRHQRSGRMEKEFEALELGDPRRERRAKKVAGRMAFRPESSLPIAMGGDAMLEGAYRLLSNEHVTLEKLVQPHVQQTVARVAAAKTAYAIHDTTGFSFGGEMLREGLGMLKGDKDQGFLAQVTLAVSADLRREALGLLAIGTRSRPVEKEKGHNEANRWSLGINVAEAQVGKGQLIHVADRESDIYQLVVEAQQKGWRFIFRAAHDRALLTEMEGEVSKLHLAARMRVPTVRVKVPLSPRGGKRPGAQRATFPARDGRMAELCFSSVKVTLKRSSELNRDEGPDGVGVNVVRVWEPDPPKGESPVEWFLLTSEPIDTQEQVQQVVEGYRTRWVIEEYFCAVKTGCAFERKQLESAHALFNMLAFCLVLAYVLLQLRTLSRDDTKRPAAEVLSVEQLECLRLVSERPVPDNPTVREALLLVAALGGHIKNNGDPGWRTLSRGWMELLRSESLYLRLRAKLSDQS